MPEYHIGIVGEDKLVENMFLSCKEVASVKTLENPLKEAEQPHKLNLVVFTGGSDVTPWFYGQKNTNSVNNLNRDIRETLWFHSFFNIPKVGICRGGQFLFVMGGGVMEQHIDGHAGQDHDVRFRAWSPPKGVIQGKNSLTSTHHQHMSEPHDLQYVIAQAPDGVNEIVYNERTKSLSFQPHPEYENADCRRIFFHMLKNAFDIFLTEKNEDVVEVGNRVEAFVPHDFAFNPEFEPPRLRRERGQG